MGKKTITLPPELEGLRLVVSVSGGKDSTAMMLALREAGIAFESVFADTGWEAPETYAYLDMLREKIGPIRTVGFPGGMVAKIRGRAGFPARMQRWCTSELKTQPIRKYIDTLGDDVVSVVGVRAEESAARAKYAQLEDDHEWGGWIWRPILDWTVDEVIAIHNRNGIPVNPLYLRGHDRVGCFPCIFARKEEIRLIAEHAPWRIDEIRALEAEANVERARRNAEQPGRYSHDQTSYFQTRMRKHNGAMPIDQVVAWSRTDRKGLPILLDVPSGGCFRWGMCERPSQVPEPTAIDETEEETDMGKKENELSTNDAVCTPPAIFEPIIAALGPIGFDPCSHPASNVPAATQVLLPTYWTDPDKPPPTEEQNGDTLILWGSGLDFHWGGMGLVYVNPPYSRLSREPWVAKARDEADEAVLLLPVRTAGVWWQESVAACQAITFLRGRVTHDGETVGAPFHQCLVYCGPRVEHWLSHAVKLGWTVLGMPWSRGGV